MPSIAQYLHLPKFHLDSGRDLRLLYTVRFLTDFTEKFSLFFLPIYLFQLGSEGALQLSSALSPLQNGILLIAAYYFLFRMTTLLFTLPVADLSFRRGQAMMLFLSQLGYMATFVILAMSRTFPSLVLLSAVTSGLRIALYWPSYHTILTKHVLRAHLGEDLGLIQVLLQLAHMIAPALGGMVVVLFGYQLLFLTSVSFIAVCAALSLFISNDTATERVTFKKVREMLQSWWMRKQTLAFAGRYFNDATLAIWPVYVFLVLGGIEKVGYLYSISFFIAILLSMIIGVYIDHNKDKKGFFGSGGLLSLLWLVRPAVFSAWSIGVVDALDRLIANYHWLFYEAIIYRVGKGKGSLTFFVVREMIISASALVFWGMLTLGFVVGSYGWTFLFIIASMGVLMSLLISDRDRIEAQ